MQLNRHNSQAYIAIGTAYIVQAQPIIDQTNSTGLADGDFANVTDLLDKAQAAYEQVLQPGFATGQSGVPPRKLKPGPRARGRPRSCEEMPWKNMARLRRPRMFTSRRYRCSS